MNWCANWKAAAKQSLGRQMVLLNLLRKQMAAHRAMREAVADVLVHSLICGSLKPPPMGVVPAPGSLYRRLTALRESATALAQLDELSAIVDAGGDKQ